MSNVIADALLFWLIDEIGLKPEDLEAIEASHIDYYDTQPLLWIMWRHQSLLSITNYRSVRIPQTTEVPYIAGGIEFKLYDQELFDKLKKPVQDRLVQLQALVGVQNANSSSNVV